MSAAREGRNDKTAARAALLARLRAISETARAVGQDTPGLEDKFQLQRHLTDQAILTTGRVFAQDAAAFASQFIGHAMPSTFIADLNGLIDQFEKAIQSRQAGKDDQTAARASIEAALASGFVALHKLDAIVTNHLLGDPGVAIAVWRGDRQDMDIGATSQGQRRREQLPRLSISFPATDASFRQRQSWRRARLRRRLRQRMEEVMTRHRTR